MRYFRKAIPVSNVTKIRRGKYKHIKAKISDILDMLSQGLSYNEVGREYGVSGSTIYLMTRPRLKTIAEIKKRSNNMCEVCHSVLSNGGDIHHKFRYKSMDEYNSLDNLQHLCDSCHSKRHRRNMVVPDV